MHGALIASCRILLTVTHRALHITVDDVSEQAGYEWISVDYPSLAEMRSGYLVDFFGAGRLIPIEKATPMHHTKPYDVRNAAALYNDKDLLLLESAHMDSLLTTGIAEHGGEKSGLVGGVIALRVPAKKPGLASIPIKRPPIFILEAPRLDGETPDWRTAARLLRRGIQPSPRKALYSGAYVYKQLATYGPMPSPEHRKDLHPCTQNLFRTLTFRQIAENVARFSAMTDGMRQVCYIAGWQQGGFDTAFPEPFGAEPRCGGLDGLREALTAMRRHNALAGLHDNFDDIDASRFPDYPHTALDEHGEPWRGWVWAGGQTRIMGYPKYVQSGAMEERVRTMTELLPLQDTYHIDVLTAEACRYDFDPSHPASAEDSFQAKMQVVEAFARRGIDVTSEMLTHPAVGKIGYALHTRMDVHDAYIPGGRFIPLVQMIYHGIIGYASPSETREQMLWGLLMGAHTFHEEDITGQLSISRYYVQNLPAMLMDELPMTDFRWEGTTARADFGAESWVEVDFAGQRYRVIYKGTMIGKDFTTFAPGPKGYLAYTMDKSLSGYPLPPVLHGAKRLLLTPLTEHGEGEPWVVELSKHAFELVIPPMTPVRIEAASM